MKSKIVFLIILFFVISGAYFALFWLKNREKSVLPATETAKSTLKLEEKAIKITPTTTITLAPKSMKPEIKIPENISLDVPFTSQAPFANWSMPWQEACEEAAVIMMHHYLEGERGGEMDKTQMNNEILEMVSWQEKNWGGHYDLKAERIAQLAREYYGYKNVSVKYDITVENIKKELVQNNPVIIPSAGRELANQYFTPPGPVYHNLVIVGYDVNGFITNDPGVWQGYKFRYTYENLFDSIHDFVDGTTKNNPTPILEGKKAMVVIK